MKKIICSSLALICIAASMVGCGDTKEKDAKAETTTVAATEAVDPAIGKWQCDKLVLDGKEMDSLYGVDAYALFQIELKDCNKGTFYSFLYSEDGKPHDIEWEEKDGKIQLISKEVFDEDEVYLVNDGGKMVLNLSDDEDDEENKATLEKVDEFKEVPEDTEMSFDISDEADVEFDESDIETETETSENKE